MSSSRRSRRNAVPMLGADLAMYRSRPRLYDVAFGFRDIAAECDGLLELARRHGVAKPASALELACGPAHHLRELARRGLRCQGIDINPEMLAYARALCRRDGVGLGSRRGEVELRCGDMRVLRPSKRFDLVLSLFDSFAQCASERDAIATLRSAASALRRGGLLFVEFTHPSDYFGATRSRTVDAWTQRDGDISVRARFTITHLDPVAETFVANLVIEPKPVARRTSGRSVTGAPRPVAMRWVQRMWLPGGFRYVALAAGSLAVVGWYGNLDPVVAPDDREQAWRMIAVLRRT